MRTPRPQDGWRMPGGHIPSVAARRVRSRRAERQFWRGADVTLDEGALVRRLHRRSAIVRADPIDGLRSRCPRYYCEARERGTGPAVSAIATDLDALARTGAREQRIER